MFIAQELGLRQCLYQPVFCDSLTHSALVLDLSGLSCLPLDVLSLFDLLRPMVDVGVLNRPRTAP